MPFDPDEARRLVMMSNPVDTLRIAVLPGSFFIRIGEQVKSDLETIGLRSEVTTRESASFWSSIAMNTADILVTLTPSQTLGALATFEAFTSKSQLAWNNSTEFDSIFMQASFEPNNDAILRLQRLLTETGVVVPMVEDQAAYLVAKNIRPVFGPDGEVGDLGSWGSL